MQTDRLENVEHSNCRLCGSGDLTSVFDLGDLYINDFVEREMIGKGRKAPIELLSCNNCTLVQLRHTAPQELLYSRHYWYRSGVTDTMKAALLEVASVAEEMAALEEGDVILDIGANDGTLLHSFRVPNLIRVGCEPANNLIGLLNDKADYVMHDFWDYDEYVVMQKEWGIDQAKVVTALGMFYDLEDPNRFIADARRALHRDGIFIAQLMCMATMLEKNDLGNLCHEHIEYYSMESLKYLFEKNGLEIFRIEENDVNGGSYRIFARHLAGGSIGFEEKITIDDLMAFKARIDRNRELCMDFIRSEVEKGKVVYVYGASTKGNTILQYYGLDSTLITAAAERSPEKWGKYTVGSWIPIVSEKEARDAAPDYFLVLPWAFFDEFYLREENWRMGGGKFIVPLPEFRIVE